jgi:hypothetical protein
MDFTKNSSAVCSKNAFMESCLGIKMGQVAWCEQKCYPGSMVIYGPNGTVFQRFAGEQWEPVETWIQDWEVPQGWNPRFADEGVRPTTN